VGNFKPPEVGKSKPPLTIFKIKELRISKAKKNNLVKKLVGEIREISLKKKITG
jgi:hypothetical protein